MAVMQRQHTGRPGTRVLPHTTAHRVVAERTMTATITLRAPGTTQNWDNDDEQMVTTPLAPYFTGRCRVQARATQARDVVTAEDPETVTGYLITVPADVHPAEGHRAAVTDSGDPLLDGRTLTVDQVVLGSVRFERDLFCNLID